MPLCVIRNNELHATVPLIMCVIRGDQQIAGASFKETDLPAPVHFNSNSSGTWRYKASINVLGYMVEDVVYIRPPDWWPEPISEGYVLLLLKSI
jgi:hypothetical protein